MIDFSRSTFTWHTHPWSPDPYYRYAGGFVGEPGQVYHVRFGLEASCQIIRDDASGHVVQRCLLAHRVVVSTRLRLGICSRFPAVSGAWLSATNPS